MLRRTFIGAVFVALVASTVAVPAHGAGPEDIVAADRAVQWLADQQRADGGIGPAEEDFPGFETPDAVLAIAADAQPRPGWDFAAARAAVDAVETNGRTPLGYLDDLADGDLGQPLTAGQAAKLIVLVAEPLALDPSAFDPDGDGPANLVTRMDAGRAPDGSFGAFNATLYAALAHIALDRGVRADTQALIARAQQGNGGWNFGGSPAGREVDPDTTGLAVQALVAAGADACDVRVRKALAFLSSLRGADGGWPSPFSGGRADPNSTAQVVLALNAGGYDVAGAAWRDRFRPDDAGSTYTSPLVTLRGLQRSDGRIASPGDSSGVNTLPTSQTVQALRNDWLPLVRQRVRFCQGDGYWLFARDGGTYSFGSWARVPGSGAAQIPAASIPQRPVGGAPSPTGGGFWLFGEDGGVAAFGDARLFGSLADRRVAAPIVGGAATPTGGGYWLFGRDGSVFTFGDARFFGSMGGRRLNQPIVGGARTATGGGYYLFSRDGGVFTFGDARFQGSMGGARLNQPIVGGAVASGRGGGGGYILFAADGGVFNFGSVGFFGSMGGRRLNRPVVGGSTTPTGAGYWMVAADGGIFRFGDARFLGSLGGRALPSPIVGMAS